MFNRNKHSVEVLRDLVVNLLQQENCPSLSELNNHEPEEPTDVKILLPIKG